MLTFSVGGVWMPSPKVDVGDDVAHGSDDEDEG